MNPFWLNRMLQDPVFANNLKCRWSYLRTNILSDEHLMNYIDSLGTILEEPAQRNYDRWPILGVYVWPNNFIGNTYQEELTYMKNWILARAAWMDANMFGTCSSLSVDSPNTELKIIPNPTQDFVTISGMSSDINLELRDFSGKIIRIIPINHSNTTIDLSDLANGIYFITESISGIYAKIIKN
jgi:predicted Rdx family selenoprotein